MIVLKKLLLWSVIAVLVVGGMLTFAVPNLVPDWNATRESQAIAALRSIASAQQQMQACGAIDTDGDGAGEYGFFAEIAGTVPLRPPEGAPSAELLDPSILPSTYGEVAVDSWSHGIVRRQDYLFKVYLPGPPVDGRVPAVGEAAAGGTGPARPDADEAERRFCVYAWPERDGFGRRAFFLNEGWEVMTCGELSFYRGLARVPAFDAAYTRAGDMGSPLAGLEGGAANDGNVWRPIGN